MAAVQDAPAPFPNENEEEVVYELACRRALPSLDGRKCVKHVLLGPQGLNRFNSILHHTKRAYPLLYAIAMVCVIIQLLVPSATSTGLAVTALLLATPSHVAALSALRYDMVVLVCKTFEFWYATVMNIICMMLICASLGDSRAVVVVSSAIAHQIPFFIDAVYRAPNVAIAASAYGALANAMYVVFSIFRLIPNTQHLVVVTLLDRRLTSNVIISNGLLTIALLLGRNAYRKYQIMKKIQKPTTVGWSIVYRCCVQLRPVLRSGPTASILPPSTSSHSSNRTIQLVFDGSGKQFKASDVVFPRRFGGLSLHRWSRTSLAILNGAGLIGLIALAVSHLPQALIPDFGYHTEICLTAFVGTAVFVSVYVMHCQRLLLFRELGHSFDFLLISSQSLLAHLCVCELYAWDIRCFGVASSWLWCQWMVILDAVTPAMRRKLGYHEHGAIAVGSVLLFEQVSFVLDLVVFGTLKLHERELFTINLPGHAVSVTILPIFLGRVVLTFLWYSRIAWRLFERKDNELLVLQGQLQYEDLELRRRVTIGPSSRAATTAVLRSPSWRVTSMATSSGGSRRGPTWKKSFG